MESFSHATSFAPMFDSGAEMSPFSIVEVRRIRFGRRIKQEERVDIHCHCQMPYDSNEQDSDMIQSNMCLMWYHERCMTSNIVNGFVQYIMIY